jgi:hypothetical protein
VGRLFFLLSSSLLQPRVTSSPLEQVPHGRVTTFDEEEEDESENILSRGRPGPESKPESRSSPNLLHFSSEAFHPISPPPPTLTLITLLITYFMRRDLGGRRVTSFQAGLDSRPQLTITTQSLFLP